MPRCRAAFGPTTEEPLDPAARDEAANHVEEEAYGLRLEEPALRQRVAMRA